jgi:hypothetical protein
VDSEHSHSWSLKYLQTSIQGKKKNKKNISFHLLKVVGNLKILCFIMLSSHYVYKEIYIFLGGKIIIYIFSCLSFLKLIEVKWTVHLTCNCMFLLWGTCIIYIYIYVIVEMQVPLSNCSLINDSLLYSIK